MILQFAGLKIKAVREAFSDNVLVQIVQRIDGAHPHISVAQPLTFVEVQAGESCPPCMNLDFTQAQYLMDQLWDCGLRPSEGSGSAGQLAATQRHLEDMRALVFKEGSK